MVFRDHNNIAFSGLVTSYFTVDVMNLSLYAQPNYWRSTSSARAEKRTESKKKKMKEIHEVRAKGMKTIIYAQNLTKVMCSVSSIRDEYIAILRRDLMRDFR